MASDVEVMFGGNASALNSTIDEVKDKLGEVGEHAHRAGEESEGGFAGFIEKIGETIESLSSLKGALGTIAEVAIGAFAANQIIEFGEKIGEVIEKVSEFAESMAHLGFEAEKAVQILGASPEEVAGLQAMAAATGSSLESMEQQLSRAFRNIVAGSKQARDAAAYFGLSLDELAKMPMEEALGKIADAYAAMPPGIQRTAEAQMLLGRGATALAPILAQGARGLDEMREMAERAGTVIGPHLSSQMHATHEALTEFGQATIGLGEAVFGVFEGAITGAAQIMVDFVESLSSSIRESTALHAALWVLNAAIGGIEIVIAEVIAIFKDLWDAGDAAIQSLVVGFTVLAQTIAEVFKPIKASIEAAYDLAHGDISGAAAASKVAVGGIDTGKIKQDWSEAVDHIKKIWEEFHANEKRLNEELANEIKKIGGAQDENKKKTDETAEATGELRKKWQEVMDGVKDSGGEIDKLNSQIETLKEALGQAATSGQDLGAGMKATGSAVDMIKGFEGFSAKAYWDVNAYRIGYGSDTMTDAAGKVTKVMADSTTTIEDANRDLARRVAEFQNEAAKQIGDGWAALSDRVKASITSVAYNYGHVPAQVIAAARTGNEAAIAESIRGLDANKTRRAAEAANITATGTSVVPPEKVAETKAALDELIKKRDELMKGTPRDIAEAKALDDQIKGHGDVIKAKEAEIAADKEMIASETDLKKKREDEKRLQEDMLALEKLRTAAKEAELKGAEAGAKGDPKAEHDAAMALLNLKYEQAKKLYGAESAEAIAAKNEIAAADRKFTSETNALTKERIEEDRKALHDSANEQIKALDDARSQKTISDAQWLASKKAILEQEFEADKKLTEQESALDGATTEEKLKNANKIADERRKLNNQEADDARKAADDARRAYDKMSNDIASTFSTAIKGMIHGHETFRQAVMKGMGNLADKFIDWVTQMVVKWAMGETAKTASTTAGNAARAASEQAGSAAGMAAQAGGILKSIFASAGQAFAGVFGFLSPVMGPAAAGPAAAAEATVIGTGSAAVSAADIGMWRVPHDQLALIHRSELVMPAAQADAFRAMLSGSNPIGGGGGMGVSIHPSVNMHVSALDGDSVKSFMRSNQRNIMQSMHSAVRSGAHLGLKALT